MPYYNYECKACGNEFEKFEKVENREEPCQLPCPSCKSLSVKIKISATPNFWNCSKPTNS